MAPLNDISKHERDCIVSRLNREGRLLILRQRNGRLRFCNPDKYYNHKWRMREVIQKHQPWKKREKPPLGPLGTKPLGAAPTLSRATFYEHL